MQWRDEMQNMLASGTGGASGIMHSCPEAHRWEILGAKKDALAEAYCWVGSAL